ncbi:MAG TPA: ABC transporter substrate-binding protein [Acidobacteriota bacterium]|nr:ABC transporter substrate-binding protein [Acidobacteriota bacterium]
MRGRGSAMLRALRRSGIASLLFLWQGTGITVSAQEPVKDLRQFAHEYAGPGRDEDLPAPPATMPIAYFGPFTNEDVDYDLDLWRAAVLAVEELNEASAVRPPLQLIPIWSPNPWGGGISDLAKELFGGPSLAVLTGVTGDAVHLAEQIATKARVPVVNGGSSDETAHRASVPWLFSCLPGESAQAPLLVEHLQHLAGERPFLLLTSTSHDSRVFTDVLSRLLSHRGLSPRLHLQTDPGATALPQALEGLDFHEIAAVILIGEPVFSAGIYQRLREVFSGPVFGSSAFGRRAFLETWERSPGPVYFPYPADPHGVERFSEKFSTRFQRRGDFAAASTYDAVKLLTAALQISGPNRARLLDALRAVVPWKCSTGVIDWDLPGQNTRRPLLATLFDGHVVPAP